MAFVDLWGWFDDYEREAYRTSDELRQRLTHLNYEGWQQREVAPHQALALFTQGRLLAQQLNEPCWVLFYDYWRCEVYLFYIGDTAAALNLAVRAAVEARKPGYAHCPVRGRVYRVLVDSYADMDPLAHAEQIREMLDYMEHEVPLDLDTWRLLEAERAGLALELDDLDAAEAAALRYLDRSGDSDFRLTNAYSTLCEISYRRRDWESVNRYAQLGEHHSRRAHRESDRCEHVAWQALCARQTGDEDRAGRLYRTATAQAARLGRPPSESFFKALCDYHLERGEIESALKCLEQERETTRRTGSPYREAKHHLKHCRVLMKLGLPLDEALTLTRALLTQLPRPALLLKKLDQIAAGQDPT